MTKKYVKCINAKEANGVIKLGQIYEVVQYYTRFIDIRIDGVLETGFYSHRFEEVPSNMQKLKDFK